MPLSQRRLVMELELLAEVYRADSAQELGALERALLKVWVEV